MLVGSFSIVFVVTVLVNWNHAAPSSKPGDQIQSLDEQGILGYFEPAGVFSNEGISKDSLEEGLRVNSPADVETLLSSPPQDDPNGEDLNVLGNLDDSDKAWEELEELLERLDSAPSLPEPKTQELSFPTIELTVAASNGESRVNRSVKKDLSALDKDLTQEELKLLGDAFKIEEIQSPDALLEKLPEPLPVLNTNDIANESQPKDEGFSISTEIPPPMHMVLVEGIQTSSSKPGTPALITINNWEQRRADETVDDSNGSKRPFYLITGPFIIDNGLVTTYEVEGPIENPEVIALHTNQWDHLHPQEALKGLVPTQHHLVHFD